MSDGTFPRPPRPYPSRAPDDADGRDSSSDPLMELARLIGQSDPFAPPPARSGDSPRGVRDRPTRALDLPTRGPMARPPSRALSPEPDPYEADQEREARPPRSHPFPALQISPSRSLPSDDRPRDERPRDDRVRDDRGGDGYSEPARVDAAPATHERFEFPELGSP